MSEQMGVLRLANMLTKINCENRNILISAANELRRLHKENTKMKRDAARLESLAARAYVGIAPYPRQHEVWCIELPNPKSCNDFVAAVDAAIVGQS